MLLLAIVLVLTPPTHREAEGVLAVAEPETVAAATPRAKLILQARRAGLAGPLAASLRGGDDAARA
jgi:hypothetical protein